MTPRSRTDYVFVVGCNRTGTSLLRQILNQSEQLCLAAETHFLRRLALVGADRALARLGDLRDDASVQRLAAFIYANNRAWHVSYWEWLKRRMSQDEFARRLRATDRTERGVFALLMQIYAEQARGDAAPDLILGEKTPTHLYYVPTLLEWFPRAKVLHTIRDPRAVIVSKLKKVNEKPRDGLEKKYTALPPWLLAPLTDPLEIAHTSRAWLDAARLHTVYERRYPDAYRLVRFEDLVGDPEREISRICEFVGIPFERRMMDDVHVVASSFQSKHRGSAGIDQAALERWRGHSHPLVNAGFSILGRAQLKRFGYTP